jgi:hypothetical protein
VEGLSFKKFIDDVIIRRFGNFSQQLILQFYGIYSKLYERSVYF